MKRLKEDFEKELEETKNELTKAVNERDEMKS